MTTIKIDLQNGTLDVEGEESFVKEIYNDFKEKIVERQGGQKNDSATAATTEKNEERIKTSRKPIKQDTYKATDDINTKNLKEFYAEKSPGTKYESNTVFVYFLEKKQNIQKITIDHLYTCYKLVGVKVPKALRQSLVDTAFHKKYISTKDLNAIKVAIVGENLVDHDLPRAKN